MVCSEQQLMKTARSRLLMPPLSRKKTDNEMEKQTNRENDSLSGDALYEKIDKTATWLVHSYVRSCNKFSRSRCCLVLLLNASPHMVTVLHAELTKGRVLHSLDGSGGCNDSDTGDSDHHDFDSDKKSTLAPNNGFALYFGCGFPPSFYESGAVELTLTTSVFDAVLCTDVMKSTITEGGGGGGSGACSSGGSRVGFIEKSSKEWWSKYCILIS